MIALDTPFTKNIEVIGFKILDNVSVTLFSSVNICIIFTLRCGEKQWDEQKELLLTGEEYSTWGNDDQYIIDLVKSRLSTLI
jgi:hypothetical protein